MCTRREKGIRNQDLYNREKLMIRDSHAHLKIIIDDTSKFVALSE